MLFIAYLLIAAGYLFLSPAIGIVELILTAALMLLHKKYAKRWMRIAAIAVGTIAGINLCFLCVLLIGQALKVF